MKRIAFVVSWFYKTFTPTTILVTIFHICMCDDVTLVNEKSIVSWNIWNLTRNVYLMSIFSITTSRYQDLLEQSNYYHEIDFFQIYLDIGSVNKLASLSELFMTETW